MRFHRVYAPAVITMLALADPRLVQAPRSPDDVTPSLEEAPRSKSDAQRLVGTVREIDQTRGIVTLETDEGPRVVRPSAQLLGALRIGDTISVPRSEDEAVGGSPRTR